MLTREEIEMRARSSMVAAQGMLESGRELTPILMIELVGVPHFTPLQMRNERDKAALEYAIPNLIRDVKPDCATMIADGWLKDPNDFNKRIGEVITVSGVWPGGSFLAECRYTRNEEGKPVFGETTVDFTGVYSRFFKGAYADRMEGRS